MSPSVRVLVADSNELFYIGIQKILETAENVLCVDRAVTSQQALELCDELLPDLLLLGVNLQDMPILEVICTLRQRIYQPLILMMLTNDGEEDIQALVGAGIDGAILKKEKPGKFIEAIETLAFGEAWFSPLLIKCILQPRTLLPQLNGRELSLLKLMVEGKMDAAIANELSVSEPTVRRCIKTICDKLQVQTRLQLAYRVGELKLLAK